MQRWPETSAQDRADLASCRTLLRGGSRTFFLASLLLPPNVRNPATALYAFCRVADDAIDMTDACSRGAALGRLRERLDRAYQGRPLPVAADRALAQAVAHFCIPRTLLDALLDGFEWDAQGRRYEDLPALHEYAARVAGTVGAMMATVMGVRAPDVAARACDLGVAMQLSNIARDVGEDARAGRLYLPLQWLREAGIEPDSFLARPHSSAALGQVVHRLLGHADGLYARAAAGIAQLPLACRPGIGAARRLYAEIGHAAGRLDGDVARRATVSASRKAWLLARMAAVPERPPRAPAAAPLPAVQFLVDAVAAAPLRRPLHVRHDPRLQAVQDPASWVLGLFERLERREQMLRQPARPSC